MLFNASEFRFDLSENRELFLALPPVARLPLFITRAPLLCLAKIDDWGRVKRTPPCVICIRMLYGKVASANTLMRLLSIFLQENQTPGSVLKRKPRNYSWNISNFGENPKN